MRKGYNQEYKVKTKLERIYGRGNVIKTTSSQNIPDFVIIKKEKMLQKTPFVISWFVFGVEVKSTIKKRYSATPHDKEQYKEFGKWRVSTGCQVYYRIVYRRKPKNVVEEYDYGQFGDTFINTKH